MSAVKAMGKLWFVSASETQPTFVMFFAQTSERYSTTDLATSSRSAAASTLPAMTARLLEY
jgi:hypothetical protein